MSLPKNVRSSPVSPPAVRIHYRIVIAVANHVHESCIRDVLRDDDAAKCSWTMSSECAYRRTVVCLEDNDRVGPNTSTWYWSISFLASYLSMMAQYWLTKLWPSLVSQLLVDRSLAISVAMAKH
ncbi:hypothetical protein G5I_07697 [Acromyrmex echinatior]|uniref:Uncharacterized protein n=1 Tax=Acromyrmex echinatior TaxID=103372 RepID=F4WPI2_ACREC|nr:hypothetical protein G5I_07697 [Acromyrmex echinatior]